VTWTSEPEWASFLPGIPYFVLSQPVGGWALPWASSSSTPFEEGVGCCRPGYPRARHPWRRDWGVFPTNSPTTRSRPPAGTPASTAYFVDGEESETSIRFGSEFRHTVFQNNTKLLLINSMFYYFRKLKMRGVCCCRSVVHGRWLFAAKKIEERQMVYHLRLLTFKTIAHTDNREHKDCYVSYIFNFLL
jgi:hypothetical protein